MGIFEALKNIFDTKFSLILKDNKFVLFDFSKNTSDALEARDGGTLSIDISKTTENERKQIKEKILDVQIQESDKTFLIDKYTEKTQCIRSNLPTKQQDMELLKFYRDKLNPDMYRALEASLVMRNVFRNGGKVTEIKRDISRQYPQFGNNLCNLVNEGYFDEHFKELYYSMLEEENFDIRNYSIKVENITRSLPYTVFVTQFKKYEDLSGELNYKLTRLRGYGAGKLLLHGIGRDNVIRVRDLIKEYDGEQGISVDLEVNPQETVISAVIKFG